MANGETILHPVRSTAFSAIFLRAIGPKNSTFCKNALTRDVSRYLESCRCAWTPREIMTSILGKQIARGVPAPRYSSK